MATTTILEVTDGNFDQEVLQSEMPVMVDFWAAWCGPCRALAPVVDELAVSYGGKLKVAKMDVDKNSSTPNRYNVRGIPTLLIFKGGELKDQLVGFVPKETIEKAIQKHVTTQTYPGTVTEPTGARPAANLPKTAPVEDSRSPR
jgi:thioredoxin 1